MRDQLAVLQAASSELMACSDFMILLRAVLTLGNHLNEGTMRGAASGGRSGLALAKTLSEQSCCSNVMQTLSGAPQQECCCRALCMLGNLTVRAPCKEVPQAHSVASALRRLRWQ